MCGAYLRSGELSFPSLRVEFFMKSLGIFLHKRSFSSPPLIYSVIYLHQSRFVDIYTLGGYNPVLFIL